ncbi:tetratricopeptide (TPR) repeat protein [Azospirillum lipoferum]|uniref:Tetratricopeptide repeat protein n=1 Tax=Azospirillum lipoferum TaxID=193 RepID=A0A5A9GW21_AZOLI|nr:MULTISPECIES: tetratricopeptide repeat protein [Azospirillum]KAA0598590.1 tetratricopeptide repeat protein [Azospirillum lipoferum]MCP1609396.1 tetratricopeptide (TPR) repeat protein [Azospirillum lipoferum]MDW5535295.1 tetratricopeptide repeat protein [Azospirillum sp. NL1]
MVTLSQALLIALDHHQAGRLAEAEDIYRRILGADPEYADALELLGVLAAQTGRLAEATRCLRLAVALRPEGAGGLSNLAGVEQSSGALALAVRLYGRALRLLPDLADAHASRAGALRRLGQALPALTATGLALALAPDHADALANRAAALLSCGEPITAEHCARRSLRLNPRSAVTHATLAAALAAQRRWAEAESAARDSLALDRSTAEAWEVLGSVLARLARFPDSLDAFAMAERLHPGPSLSAARGTALIAMARPAEAAADFERALADRPQDAGLHWNLGFARLMAGDYEGGWPEFDWRRHDDRAEPPWRRLNQPTWRGEPLNGRTILLYAEQGLGDTLQFLRYVPLVAARSGRVVLEVQRPLLPLLEPLPGVEGAVQVVARGDPLPSFDLECPLMSLPRAFDTGLDGVPADTPYLRPDPARVARWRDRLGPHAALRVGVVWAGNPRFPADAERSPKLAGLRGLFDVPGCCFYGLQMGPGRADLADRILPDSFSDLGAEIADFADTAAIMANLDLVVSSCTGPAHLAGALGLPLWLALPFSPDWRWLTGRDDSPWYPTARLFRQPAPGDWPAVAGRMAAELVVLAQRFRPLP